LCANNSSEKLSDVIQLLIQLGIDKNGKDNDGWNALHFLCSNNSSEKLSNAIQLLIQLGIDKNEKDNEGWNALHFLCSNNSSEKLSDAIQLLIQHGIEVNSNEIDARSLIRRRNNQKIENIEEIIQLLDRAAIN
jgi:ankyrin repeat protein